MDFCSKIFGCCVVVSWLIVVGWTSPCTAQKNVEPSLPESWSEQVDWRSIGPANMMGRITSIAVYEKNPSIWWAASASGGLLKTVNNGNTFEHQFDKQSTVSIGDVQVSKTDPNLLWVGTGEANPRNSVSWGDGVYKSTDGGKTWANMGLKESFQTGRIAIHPENHDIVYVGALGRLWGPNEQRGLFKTIDGGKTWEKILFVDDKTGVVDVQMNPENPDELLVATYQRMRDGFDGNDPATKYGPGSAIHKTVDGGKTFQRISKGLPSCDLGRIGLSYFRGDTRFVAAIVESEKIAKEPETAAYAGLRGENADVGAKITQVTEDGPAAKAGLLENDIVVSIEGDIVYSYTDLQAKIREHVAGEEIKLVVSRERKPIDLAIKLAPKPKRRNGRRSGRSPFTGTLGGQAANLQGQQGENEQEYGGVYLSEDGGDSWKRINTLNPRPMYYSQIRVDPSNRENMYVLGTSLYRSSDGGKTFTGDGGRGIHVDHHALWVDPNNSQHIILGNDGGVYITHDRMDNWDHHNHAAIGQFYHAGIGSRENYRVYGGLQDNGSWGGPSRVNNDSGSINTDWFRVGGGDGFVTLADPDDPDQIYFESQNGGMGRINLRTGDRGFIRPRAPRGTRYRFNWKTPFLLSPHNSKIHYSAGNHVFRSYNKGAGVKAISPDITNTDKGAGSAITESPVEAGVIYVGTTDGALWMTRNGGQEWVALFSKKEKKGEQSSEAEKADANDESNAESKPDKTSDEGPDAPQSEAGQLTAHSISGVWNGKLVSDRFPEGQQPTVTFTLTANDKGKVSGEIETRRGAQEIADGTVDFKSGKLEITIESDRGTRTYSATVKGKKMSGELEARGGRFQIEFEAERQEDPGGGQSISLSSAPVLLNALLVAPASRDDPISGTWSGVVQSEQIPNGEIEFTMELKWDAKEGVTGVIDSVRGEFKVSEGDFKADSKKLYFYCESDEVTLDFEAIVDGKQMTGDVSINDTLSADFSATRTKAAKTVESSAEKKKLVQEEEKIIEKSDAEGAGGRQPGFLGVVLGDGLTLSQIVPNSPAERAGLLVNDELLSVGGKSVGTPQDVLNELRKMFAGDSLELTVNRDGEEKTIKVVLGPRPNTADLTRSMVDSDDGDSGQETESEKQDSDDKAVAENDRRFDFGNVERGNRVSAG